MCIFCMLGILGYIKFFIRLILFWTNSIVYFEIIQIM